MNPHITAILHKWYCAHKRALPWRETRDPYRIWVSEIILQQTQVVQGLSYYHRFVDTFPDITTLATASETKVLQQWQGLGYYSRARNMHHTAKTLVANWNGRFPETYRELLSLKGIGPYTASAIASIAFNLPYAVVDGNVFRLLSRLFALSAPVDTPSGKKQFEQLAQQLLDHKSPSTHNQAMMEMGALICKPANPQCTLCPLSPYCEAFAQQTQPYYPVKSKRIVRKKRYLNFLILKNNQQLALQKRTAKDIWKGLFQPPLMETETPADAASIEGLIEKHWGEKIAIQPIKQVKHLLTHQELHLYFYFIDWQKKQRLPSSLVNNELIFIDMEALNEYPLPKPLQKILLSITHKYKSGSDLLG